MAYEWRVSPVGTVQDAHGEDIDIGVTYLVGAGPDDDWEPKVTIGHSIELGQEEAEEFARVFVSACWEAVRAAS